MADGDLSPFSIGPGDLEQEKRNSAPAWIKVPARSTVLVCVLAELPVRFALHFVGGRPQLCWGRGRCGHCADRLGAKVHYVYPAYDRTRRTMGAIDVPPGVEEVLSMARSEKGFLKGLVVALKKEGGVDNGRIQAEVLHQILDTQVLGEPLDVQELLCRQYGLERVVLESTADVP